MIDARAFVSVATYQQTAVATAEAVVVVEWLDALLRLLRLRRSIASIGHFRSAVKKKVLCRVFLRFYQYFLSLRPMIPRQTAAPHLHGNGMSTFIASKS